MLAIATRNEISHLPATRAPVAANSLAQHLTMGTVRALQAKEHVFRAGDTASHVYKVEAGCICIYHLMADGRRQVIDFAYPGDIIGLGAVEEHHANAEALTLAKLRSIPVSLLYNHARSDAQLSLKLFEHAARELASTQQMLFTLNQRSACEKVAAFLLALSQRNGSNGGDAMRLVLPMTRTDIADFLGLTIETVSRTLTKFRRKGLIDLAQCANVTILDIEALSELAEGGSA